MKICPVCNDSFADQLNFCDVDGARLTREASVQERNKWWSLLGVGLLVGALVISAASIIFLPKARVSPSPVVTSEPPPSPVPPKAPSADSTASVAVSAVTPDADSASTDAVVPDVKKKDKALANADAGGPTPNPKAAALAAEDAEKKAVPAEVNGATPLAPKKPEAPPAVKSASETHSPDVATKPQTPPDLQKDQKTQAATAKSHDKDSKDKKKDDEKKKGGFLRVFKKIFGKD